MAVLAFAHVGDEEISLASCHDGCIGVLQTDVQLCCHCCSDWALLVERSKGDLLHLTVVVLPSTHEEMLGLHCGLSLASLSAARN